MSTFGVSIRYIGIVERCRADGSADFRFNKFNQERHVTFVARFDSLLSCPGYNIVILGFAILKMLSEMWRNKVDAN